jgi:hypothetical protein
MEAAILFMIAMGNPGMRNRLSGALVAAPAPMRAWSARRGSRNRWAPYIKGCVQAGKRPQNLPSAIRAEIKEAGGLRDWLAFYVAPLPLS